MIVGFDLGGRDVSDRFEQAAGVVPVDPLHRGDLDGGHDAPRSLAVDHIGLEQAVDALGHGVLRFQMFPRTI